MTNNGGGENAGKVGGADEDLEPADWLNCTRVGNEEGIFMCDGCSQKHEVTATDPDEAPTYYAYAAAPGNNRENTEIRYVYCDECGQKEATIEAPTRSFTEHVVKGVVVRDDPNRPPHFENAVIIEEKPYGVGSV